MLLERVERVDEVDGRRRLGPARRGDGGRCVGGLEGRPLRGLRLLGEGESGDDAVPGLQGEEERARVSFGLEREEEVRATARERERTCRREAAPEGSTAAVDADDDVVLLRLLCGRV